jgi:hypothetical protein
MVADVEGMEEMIRQAVLWIFDFQLPIYNWAPNQDDGRAALQSAIDIRKLKIGI